MIHQPVSAAVTHEGAVDTFNTFTVTASTSALHV